MATPAEKLAASLEVLKEFQNKDGIAIIRARDIARTHKDRLVSKGFLREVIKGWYISVGPDIPGGDSTSWYTSFWYFVSVYFNERFGNEWCLSPEQSLFIHSGNYTVPKQLLVRSPKASNNKISLLHDTSFFDLTSSIPPKEEIEEKTGLILFSLTSALIACSPNFYSQFPTDAKAALAMVKDSSEVLAKLLNGGHSIIAGRLAGAFRSIGRERIANEIIAGMNSADYKVREKDPFKDRETLIFDAREYSPYLNRIKLMWQKMRKPVIEKLPASGGMPDNIDEYLKQVDEIYVNDAYHSLSIEGYNVTTELIDKVRKGDWNPDKDDKGRKQVDAMAARGYWQAFQAVKISIKEILEGKDAGTVAENDHGKWFRELFSPSVTAGVIKPSDLAGYRNGPVFIRGSKHTPPSAEAIRDAMPSFFDLLKEETEPSVRAVLGHFIFVYLHPYRDGNGRIGRFLMNTMLASGGYPWTIISLENRDEYMEALERASVEQDISTFVDLIANLVKEGLKDFS
jgi:fido (protein-threonine AMPylation protein)